MPSGARSSSWTYLALEAGLIVLSVLLAFGVREWRAAQHQEELARQALANVAAELRANRAKVRRAHAYHTQVGDSLGAIRERGVAEQRVAQHFGEIFPRGMVNTGRVTTMAWDAMQRTGAIRHVDYGTVAALSSVYEQQAAYENQAEWVGQTVYTTLVEGGMDRMHETAVNARPIVGSFAGRERRLAPRYTQALVHLAETGVDTTADDAPAADASTAAR